MFLPQGEPGGFGRPESGMERDGSTYSQRGRFGVVIWPFLTSIAGYMEIQVEGEFNGPPHLGDGHGA